MSFSRSTLLLALVAALCLLMAPSTVSAQGNAMIFIDNTNAYSVILPSPAATMIDRTTYMGVGVMQFTLDWNNDQADTITMSLVPNTNTNNFGGSINVTAVGVNASYCSGNIQTMTSFKNNAAGSLLLNVSHSNCTYQVTYAQWGGELSIDYNNGTTSGTIDVLFSPRAIVVGDPQFVGLRGQSYQVHGIDGAVYNLISEMHTQVNSRFVFLNQGQCPIIDGVADTNCWSHPGSYLGELSFQQVVDGKVHAALITSGSAEAGFSGVQVDGKKVTVGDSVTIGSFSLSVHSSHLVEVETDHFHFELSNSDLFINQALRTKVPLSKLQAHGLLGQTHSVKLYNTPLRFIQGLVDDYVIADEDIFGTSFLYNQFHA